MKKVKFLQDFQGTETKGLFFRKDKEYELDDDLAERMIYDGRAVSTFVHEYKEETPQFENITPPPYELPEAESPVTDGEIFGNVYVSKKKRGKK